MDRSSAREVGEEAAIVRVVIFLITGDNIYESAETLTYEEVKRITVEGEGLTAMLTLHRAKGNVGVPVIRVHHYEEVKTQ